LEQRRLRELGSGELAHRRRELGGGGARGGHGLPWGGLSAAEGGRKRAVHGSSARRRSRDGVWRRSGEWLATGRPWEDSARLGGVGALGGAAQRCMSAARGEQQLVDGGMARERARKLAERAGTRRA